LSFFSPDFAGKSLFPWLLGEAAKPEEMLVHGESLVPLLVRAPDRQEFFTLHADILARLEGREFQKVVPVVTESIEFTRTPRLADFASTLNTPQNNQFSYGFELGQDGMCGVTPEILFRVSGGILETMALAGTAEANGPDLLKDPKEMLEHSLVIENLEKVLRPWGQLECGPTTERKFGSLKHLHTPLRVSLNQLPRFDELCRILHPTAALGGWPKQAAWDWLGKQSFHFSRGRFGAPFGFVDGEDMLCVVAIRGIQWEGAQAQIHTGCGVVQGSVAGREWDELALKREATHRHLGLHLC
jgi:menaquinone-specific isochorismate synthase